MSTKNAIPVVQGGITVAAALATGVVSMNTNIATFLKGNTMGNTSLANALSKGSCR